MRPPVARALRALATALAAVALGLCAVGATYRPNTEIPPGVPGTHVQVHDVPLRILQAGSGRDVLLIHGSPGSVEDWVPVVDALSGSFRVTAFDRPGQGYSGDTGQYSLEHNADVALAVIDALHLDHVVVAGHSFGGAVALAMALRAPARADAYVVVDSATYTPIRKAEGLYRILDVPVLGVGVGALVSPLVAPQKIGKGLREAFSGAVPDGFVEQRVAIWSSPKVTHAVAAETLGYAGWLQAQSPRYGSIARPVFIVSEADSEPRRATAERLHWDIAGSTLTLVPQTGHFIQFERTSEVVAAIRRAAESAPWPRP